MASSIKIQNFRRFAKETYLRLNDLNVFVGKNNSGKSTMVKALMLTIDNLSFMEWENVPAGKAFFAMIDAPRPFFRFDASHFHDLHIGSFRSAKTKFANDSCLVFEFESENVKVRITVSGSEDNLDSFRLPINKIEVYSPSESFYVELDFLKYSMKLEYKGDVDLANPLQEEIAELNTKILDENKICDEYQKKLSIDNSYEYLQAIITHKDIIKKLNSAKRRLQSEMRKQKNELKPFELEIDLVYYHNPGRKILANYVDTFSELVCQKDKAMIGSNNLEDDPSDLSMEAFDKAIEKVKKSNIYPDIFRLNPYDRLVDLLDTQVDYFPAHAAAHKRLFSIEDKNDYNARVIHEYYQELIPVGSRILENLNKWLKIFGIGDSVLVTPLGSEGYYVQVLSDGDFVHLADLGMGSCQIVILLLKLATIESRIRRTNYLHYLIIEEPEQNLHPMLQSQLADLFDSFCDSHLGWVHLIIETHSEYLIRELQLLVAKAEFKDREEIKNSCTATIYYFPSSVDQAPYDMKFLPNGMFERKFEPGFFDEASNKYLQILKNAKKG